MSNYPKIMLVPVDGSEGSMNAVTLAAELAQELDIPIRLLFVFPKDPIAMFGLPSEAVNASQFRYFEPEAFDDLRDQSAAKVFEAARRATQEFNVKADQEIVLQGQPAEAILEYAGNVDNPMIIIGSRGLGGFRGLLGSVSQRVLSNAHCPVTVVRPPEK